MMYELLASIGSSSAKSNNFVNFIVEHAREIEIALILMVLVIIGLAAFLIILWRLYQKDELILKKYHIDPSDEEVNKVEILKNEETRKEEKEQQELKEEVNE